MAMKTCPQCQRHVKSAAAVCPFCSSALETSGGAMRAAALAAAAGLMVAACPAYGGAVPPISQPSPSPSESVSPPQPVYGAPAPTPSPSRPPDAQPLYGAPPPPQQ